MNLPCAFGDYVLLEHLGAGGMSEVYLARQAMGQADFVRFVVVKRVKKDLVHDPAFIRMFKDEARITSELHHAGIGQVFEFGWQDDSLFLALEYVAGLDLRAVLRLLAAREEQMPVRIAMRILSDLLEALDYAHTRRDALGQPMQIVHRDVNPRNVMLSNRGETKLIDFGVAKAANRLEETQGDSVKGKFRYMAPEQVAGAEIDGRSDLFALGLMLHEMLTGQQPFAGLNHLQIAHRLLHGAFPLLPNSFDDDLRRFYARATAASADDRFEDAAAMRAGLAPVIRAMGGLPTRDELAAFLAELDPQLDSTLRTKLERYSGDLDGITSQPAPAQNDELTSPSQTASVISTPAAVVLGLGFGLPALGAIGALTLLVIIVGFALQNTSPTEPTGQEQQLQPASRLGSTPPPERAIASKVGKDEPALPEPPPQPEPSSVPDTVEPLAQTAPAPVAPRPPTKPRPRPTPRPAASPSPVPAPAPSPAPAPASEPEPAPPEPYRPAVVVLDGEGASSLRLKGPSGIVDVGFVNAGDYTMMADFGDGPIEAGKVKLRSGDRALVKCVAAFKRCVAEVKWFPP